MYYNEWVISQKQRDQLARYFSTEPVDVVYLFGSQVTLAANKVSDVDIGVLFRGDLSKNQRFDLRVKYMGEVGGEVGFADNVDVVDLDEAPLALRYSVIKPCDYIVVHNDTRRAVFEADIMSRHYDYAYFMRQNTMTSLASIARM